MRMYALWHVPHSDRYNGYQISNRYQISGVMHVNCLSLIKFGVVSYND